MEGLSSGPLAVGQECRLPSPPHRSNTLLFTPTGTSVLRRAAANRGGVCLPRRASLGGGNAAVKPSQPLNTAVLTQPPLFLGAGVTTGGLEAQS